MELVTVKDWMSRDLISIPQDETILEAANLMQQHRIGALVVFNKKKDSFLSKRKMVGIITDTDIITKVMAKGLNPAVTLVKDHMSTKLITGTPEDTISDIGSKMIDHSIKRVIITMHGSPMAVISLTDLVDWLAQERGRTREIISENVAEIFTKIYGAEVGEKLLNQYSKVSSWMTPKIISVSDTAMVIDAAKSLAAHRISAIPVAEGEKLVGMVTLTDLVRRVVTQQLDFSTTPIRSAMTSPIITADVNSSLPEILNILSRNKIKHIPIVEKGRAVGIVSHHDTIKVILKTGMLNFFSQLSKDYSSGMMQ